MDSQDPADALNLEALYGTVTPSLLQQFAQQGIYPTAYTVYNAAVAGNISSLETLVQAGVPLPGNIVEELLYTGRRNSIIPVLEWLETKGYFFTPRTAALAAREGHTHVLDWLEQRGVFLPIEFLQYVRGYRTGHPETLQWLADRGLY